VNEQLRQLAAVGASSALQQVSNTKKWQARHCNQIATSAFRFDEYASQVNENMMKRGIANLRSSQLLKIKSMKEAMGLTSIRKGNEETTKKLRQTMIY
jgi:hypothetical protein